MRMPKSTTPSVNFLAPDNEQALISEQGSSIPTANKKLSALYFLIGLTVILLIFLGIKSISAKQQTNTNGNTLEPNQIGFFQSVKNFLFIDSIELLGKENDRINILLLGIGGPGHDGPYLSDTNIILSIKPSTNEISMVSIPRDLGIKLEDYGTYKINYADAFGESKNPGYGGDYARKIFSETFNIEIPYYARVNFNAFKQLIDAVDGISVDVANPFTDYSYPAENYAYQTITFVSGTEYMDGNRALQYSRSRHGTNGENSDFARAHRQQIVINALKNKILNFGTLANPITLQKIWKSLSSNIDTNLEFNQLLHLAKLSQDIDTSKIKNLVIDSSPNGYLYSYIASTGAFMLAPKGGDFEAINTSITNIFDPNFNIEIPLSQPIASKVTPVTNTIKSSKIPNTSTTFHSLDFLSQTKIEIQNGTWLAGLASRLQSKLAEHGLNIIKIGNSTKRPITTTTIYLLNQSVSNDITTYISKQVDGKLETELPKWLQTEYNNPNSTENELGKKADILIILGTDTNN